MKKSRLLKGAVLALSLAVMTTFGAVNIFAADGGIDPGNTAKVSQVIEANDITLTIGKTGYSKVKLTTGDGKLTFASPKSKVVSVSKRGYVKAKNVGTAVITITAAETKDYEKTVKTFTVTVIPKGTSIASLKSRAAGTIAVKWAARTKVSGFEVMYSTDNTFTTYNQITINKGKAKKAIISGNVSGQKYYVKVRVYKTVNDTNYYSKWSKIKKVTVK